MPRKPPPDRAASRNRALRALGRREHSALELKRKLKSAGTEAPDAEEIVGELQEAGFQNDARFADLLVRSRIEQGYGPIRIAADLASRGVDRAIARAALESAEVDWNELVIRLCQRRFRAAPADAAERQKRWRFLAARGFSGEQIRAGLKRGGEEAAGEDFDS